MSHVSRKNLGRIGALARESAVRKRSLAQALVWLCSALCVTAVLAAAGDVHYVKGTNVNIRSGPSTQTDVVTQVNRGDALTEVSRDGRWIQVRLAPEGGQSGWIREDLVTSTKPAAAPTPAPETTPITPPSAQELSSTRGVIAALKAAPQNRVREGFRQAIVAAGHVCIKTVGAPRQLRAQSDGVYFLVTCTNKLQYSVQVKPDGKLGTEVVSCDTLLNVTGKDICKGGE